MTYNFDVLIASTGRIQLLEKCLDSIFLEKPKELNFVRVLTQREDTETIRFLDKQTQHRSVKTIILNKMPTPGAARNILINESKAEYIHFLDDDASLGPNYYQNALSRLRKTNCTVLGGPDRAALDANLFQKTFELILCHKFVMGETNKRHFKEENIIKMATEYDLTLCNLWVRRKLFNDKKFHFNETYKRCEENAFLKRAKQEGIQFLYDSNLYVYHQRREEWWKLFKIHFLSGFYRGLLSVEDLLQFRGMFVIPFLAGAFLLMGILSSWKFLVFGFIVHTIPTGIISLKNFYEMQSWKSVYYTFKIIWCIHVGFSLGIVFGFGKGLINNEK